MTLTTLNSNPDANPLVHKIYVFFCENDVFFPFCSNFPWNQLCNYFCMPIFNEYSGHICLFDEFSVKSIISLEPILIWRKSALVSVSNACYTLHSLEIWPFSCQWYSMKSMFADFRRSKITVFIILAILNFEFLGIFDNSKKKKKNFKASKIVENGSFDVLKSAKIDFT